jgi:hypothetical protein
VGTHIRIVGPLLLNLNHGWNEMYPVWVMQPVVGTKAPPTGGSGSGSGSTGGSGAGAQSPPFSVVVVVTPKVMPHSYNNAVATVYTQPGASCTASLSYDRAANLLGALFGFQAQTVGATGQIKWAWGVDFTISGGGHVTATCSLKGQTLTGVGYFTVN